MNSMCSEGIVISRIPRSQPPLGLGTPDTTHVTEVWQGGMKNKWFG